MADLCDIEADIEAELSALPVVIHGGGFKRPVVGGWVRDLTPKDLLDLQEAHGKGFNPEQRSLKKVRHNHHVIAQMLAKGLSYQEIAEISGYGIERISTLACDPTMMELIENYREQGRDIAIDLGQRYRAIVGIASEEIMERLEDSPEEFKSMDLVDIVERLGDRAGMGPKSGLEVKGSIGVLVADATLDEIKGAVHAASRGRVVQGQAKASSGPGVIDGEVCRPSPMAEPDKQSQCQARNSPGQGGPVPEASAETVGAGTSESGEGK